MRSTISLLSQARSLLADAAATADPGERFRLAHFAALRTAAALLSERGAPASRRRRLVSVWAVLEKAAPDHAQWARYFAAGAPLRAAVEAGVSSAVSAAAADEQVCRAAAFLAVAESSAGMLAA